MDHMEKSITVDAPIAQVYEHWARVEKWPRFLKAIHEVQQLDEKRFRLKSERSGTLHDSVAEISLLIPKRRIAWRTVAGAENSGVVSLEQEPEGKTRVSLKMLYKADAGWQDPEALGKRLEHHLVCFKDYIEKGEALG
jgi:uncharacterized membrane protein